MVAEDIPSDIEQVNLEFRVSPLEDRLVPRALLFSVALDVLAINLKTDQSLTVPLNLNRSNRLENLNTLSNGF